MTAPGCFRQPEARTCELPANTRALARNSELGFGGDLICTTSNGVLTLNPKPINYSTNVIMKEHAKAPQEYYSNYITGVRIKGETLGDIDPLSKVLFSERQKQAEEGS